MAVAKCAAISASHFVTRYLQQHIILITGNRSIELVYAEHSSSEQQQK
jgi:hypothetical protein